MAISFALDDDGSFLATCATPIGSPGCHCFASCECAFFRQRRRSLHWQYGHEARCHLVNFGNFDVDLTSDISKT